MSLIKELKQVIYGLPLTTVKSRRDKIAHFCEHNGIHIEFVPARTTWRAIAPTALKPWWLKLETLKSEKRMNEHDPDRKQVQNEVTEHEITEHA